MHYEIIFWPEEMVSKHLNDGSVSYKHAAFHLARLSF